MDGRRAPPHAVRACWEGLSTGGEPSGTKAFLPSLPGNSLFPPRAPEFAAQELGRHTLSGGDLSKACLGKALAVW